VRTLSRHELAARRESRRRRDRRRRGLTLLIAIVPVAAAVLVIALLTASDSGPQIADPLQPTAINTSPQVGLTTTRRPENVVLADAEGVALRLPVPRDLVTTVAFHPLETSSSVRLDPRGTLDHEIVPRRGRPGPESAALDVGAPAGTAVYSPVSGVVAGVVDPYVVAGTDIGFEMAIAPATAAGLLVRVTHLDGPESFKNSAGPAGTRRPRVGEPVTAGVTELGRVADFSKVVDQEIARYTNDSGNHVHIEVIRAGGGT
jgi:murein DD-endopeptidase MepM/ murein hydrolase activator NlpD